MTMATICILGRLGRDPEVRATQTGKTVTSFSLAVDDGYGDQKHTTWWRCNAWDKTGESITRFFKKGDSIFITGQPASREYQDNQGQQQSVLEVTVRAWSFTGQKREEPRTAYASGGADDDVAF